MEQNHVNKVAFQPPPTVTDADMLFMDLIFAGVKKALDQHDKDTVQPKFAELLQNFKPGEGILTTITSEISKCIDSILADKLQGYNETLESILSAKLESHKKKIDKHSKNALNDMSQKLCVAFNGSVEAACEKGASNVDGHIAELLNGTSKQIVDLLSKKLEEVCDKVSNPVIEKALEMLNNANFSQNARNVEDFFTENTNAGVQQSGEDDGAPDSDSDTSVINSGINIDPDVLAKSVKVQNLAEIKLKLQERKAKMTKQKADSEAGPSGAPKRMKLSLNKAAKVDLPVIIDSSSDDDVNPDEPAKTETEKVRLPLRHKLELEQAASREKEAKGRESDGRSDDDCNVCLLAKDRPFTIPCGHIFCQFCLEEWSKTSETCPTCRQEIGEETVRKLKSYSSSA